MPGTEQPGGWMRRCGSAVVRVTEGRAPATTPPSTCHKAPANTIVLAYAGASLPLLLVAATGSQPISDRLTSEFLAQEILHSAIGLVASVQVDRVWMC
jgi:hypothetical protein